MRKAEAKKGVVVQLSGRTMEKVKLSQIRQEVERLNAAGKTEEAKKLWKQGVIEMYQGKVLDDEQTKKR